MEDEFIVAIRKIIEENITKTAEIKIEQEVENFRDRLESEKEQFITEIMKGIKIYRQQEGFDIGVNYKIILENVYRPK